MGGFEGVVLEPGQGWQELAACRNADPELFFSPDGERGSAKQVRELAAKAICRLCVVQPECAIAALKGDETYGVWGGMTEGERRRIKLLRDRAQILSLS